MTLAIPGVYFMWKTINFNVVFMFLDSFGKVKTLWTEEVDKEEGGFHYIQSISRLEM